MIEHSIVKVEKVTSVAAIAAVACIRKRFCNRIYLADVTWSEMEY